MASLELISSLALALLTLAAYSAGAVLSGRGKAVTPTLADLGSVIVLWAIGLAGRDPLGRWPAMAAGAGGGLAAGAILAALRRSSYPEARREARQKAAGHLRRAWDTWKRFAADLGSYQSRIWLALFFFTVVAPFGLLTRLFSDRLLLKPPSEGSLWSAWNRADRELEYGERQF